MIRKTLVILAASVALTAAACGGDDSDSSSPSDIAQADVVAALDLRSDGSGDYVTFDNDCAVWQVLIGEDEVAFYSAPAEANNPWGIPEGTVDESVVANDDGTIAVRIRSNDSTVSDADCHAAVEDALNEL